MAQYTAIIFDGIGLNITSLNPKKNQKRIKQVVGKKLIQTPVIGLDGQQWEIELGGMVLGTTSTNLSTNRANIEALDDVTSKALVDGIHDGNYYVVPGSLQFNDSGDDANSSYSYSFSLVEK